MSFHDIRLPSFIEVFALGEPEFSTSCATSASGREIRSSDRNEVIHKYKIKEARLSLEQFEAFNSFFKARGGRRFSFRFKDRADYAASKVIIGKGDGQSKDFQLYKIYQDSMRPFVRRITKPVNEKVNIYISSRRALVSVNHTSGIVTFANPPEQGVDIIADFEFDVPVRFSLDNFGYQFKNDGSIELSDFELIEVSE
jgi:uncharacterized protein (TIGR02217 family)